MLLELGLLMIVTGLTIAIIVGVIAGLLLELSNGSLRLGSAVVLVLVLVVTVLCFLGFILVRRIRPFLSELA
jgi:hypothetical protein